MPIEAIKKEGERCISDEYYHRNDPLNDPKIISKLGASTSSKNNDYLLVTGDSKGVLKQFPSGFVDCCITSPPYWHLRNYEKSTELGSEKTVEEYVKNLCDIFDEVKRVLKLSGSLWLNIGDTYKKKNLVGVPWRVAFGLQNRGWILRNAMIWDKVKGNPCNAKDKLRNVYEHLFHFVQSPKYYYNIDEVRNKKGEVYFANGKLTSPTGVSGTRYRKQILQSTRLSKDEKKKALNSLEETLVKLRKGELSDFRMIIRGVHRVTHSDSERISGRAKELAEKGFCILPYHKKGSKPGDIWRVLPEDNQRKDSHFAVYPEELCVMPIKLTSKKGGIVLDPFVGSGTSVLASLKLNRRCLGIDASNLYTKEAQKRICQLMDIVSQ